MFRTLIYPSSGECDYSVELPHWSYCSWFDVCWSFGVVGLEWYPCCRLQPTPTTPTQPHRNSNTHRTKNNTTNVVFQQNSRNLLMMDILMSETCWAHKTWNKIASDIKLVFYSSTNFGLSESYCLHPYFHQLYSLRMKFLLAKFLFNCPEYSDRLCPQLQHTLRSKTVWNTLVLSFPPFCEFSSLYVIPL